MTEHETTGPTLTPQQIEGRLLAALSTIEATWDAMLTPPAPRMGTPTNGTGVSLPDDSDGTEDTPRTVQVMDARLDVIACLRSWCQVVVEDHDVEHGIPSGKDAPGMARFLTRWSYLLAEHEAALDLLEEVCAACATVEKWAPPQHHPPATWAPPLRTMKLGSCPLTWQDPDTAEDHPCPGQLRGDEEGWVTCNGCGTRAVMGWWEQQLAEDMRPHLMTLDEVRVYLHRQHGMRLTRRALRAWVERDHLVHSGKAEDTGHHLYDVGAVEAAVTRRERMPRVV